MPRDEADNSLAPRFSGQMNDSQQNRLRITCQYIDKLLCDMEHILHQATSPSPFPRYVVDVAPAHVRVVEDYIRRLRQQLLRSLEWQHLQPKSPDIPATRAVLTNLAFIDIAVEELRPSYMRGSGAVPDDAVAELNGVVHELRSLVESAERYLRQELSASLETRLQKLEQTGGDVPLLRAIESVVTRHGLVEFRPRISAIAARMEDNHLEVALFGRVSSGKSSLLNALLERDVLPVGVNPITALPTRLRYGPALRAAVTFADGRSESFPVDQLASLVTEQGNPGNLRNVARALVEVPSRRLQQGIVLVDTPGLGSLARKGAAETLAYLPVCDLALVLIYAGAALNDEDIATLRLLYEAGIPSLVLLSKADLLADPDLGSATAYIESQLHSELGVSVHVHAVSALPGSSSLLDRFFQQQLLPRFAEAQILRAASMARKIGALRESVAAALETLIDRDRRSAATVVPPELESRLRLITGEIGELRTSLDHAFLAMGESWAAVIDQVAAQAVAWIHANPRQPVPALQASEWIHDVVQHRVHQQIERLRAAVSSAVQTLDESADVLGSSEHPALQDFETILRDAPRFELASLPADISAGRWQWMGTRVLQSTIARSLRRSTGSALEQELHRYGSALRQWSEQAIRETVRLVNSYADAFRAQMQRMQGVSDAVSAIDKIKEDCELLRQWRADAKLDLADKRV